MLNTNLTAIILLFASLIGICRASSAPLVLSILPGSYDPETHTVPTEHGITVVPYMHSSSSTVTEAQLTRVCDIGAPMTVTATINEPYTFPPPTGADVSITCRIVGTYIDMFGNEALAIPTESFTHVYSVSAVKVMLLTAAPNPDIVEANGQIVVGANSETFVVTAVSATGQAITGRPASAAVYCANAQDSSLPDTLIAKYSVQTGSVSSFKPDVSMNGRMCRLEVAMWTQGQVWRDSVNFYTRIVASFSKLIATSPPHAQVGFSHFYMPSATSGAAPEQEIVLREEVFCGAGNNLVWSRDRTVMSKDWNEQLQEIFVATDGGSGSPSDVWTTIHGTAGLSDGSLCNLAIAATMNVEDASTTTVDVNFQLATYHSKQSAYFSVPQTASEIFVFPTVDADRHKVMPMRYISGGNADTALMTRTASGAVGNGDFVFEDVTYTSPGTLRPNLNGSWENRSVVNTGSVVIPDNDYSTNYITMAFTVKRTGYYYINWFSEANGGHKANMQNEGAISRGSGWGDTCGGLNCCSTGTAPDQDWKSSVRPIHYTAGQIFRSRFYTSMGCYGFGKGLNFRLDLRYVPDPSASLPSNFAPATGDMEIFSVYSTKQLRTLRPNEVPDWKLTEVRGIEAGFRVRQGSFEATSGTMISRSNVVVDPSAIPKKPVLQFSPTSFTDNGSDGAANGARYTLRPIAEEAQLTFGLVAQDATVINDGASRFEVSCETVDIDGSHAIPVVGTNPASGASNSFVTIALPDRANVPDTGVICKVHAVLTYKSNTLYDSDQQMSSGEAVEGDFAFTIDPDPAPVLDSATVRLMDPAPSEVIDPENPYMDGADIVVVATLMQRVGRLGILQEIAADAAPDADLVVQCTSRNDIPQSGEVVSGPTLTPVQVARPQLSEDMKCVVTASLTVEQNGETKNFLAETGVFSLRSTGSVPPPAGDDSEVPSAEVVPFSMAMQSNLASPAIVSAAVACGSTLIGCLIVAWIARSSIITMERAKLAARWAAAAESEYEYEYEYSDEEQV